MAQHERWTINLEKRPGVTILRVFVDGGARARKSVEALRGRLRICGCREVSHKIRRLLQESVHATLQGKRVTVREAEGGLLGPWVISESAWDGACFTLLVESFARAARAAPLNNAAATDALRHGVSWKRRRGR